jgi:hypothetical protein
VRPPSGWNSPQGCSLILRWSAWVSTSSPWATVHTSCLAKTDACNFRALTAEKRAKETGDAPTNRLEITATMPSNFALVRLGQHQLALCHSARQLPRKR